MKNLNGFLKKIPYLFSPLLLLLFLTPISSDENFHIYTTFQHVLFGDTVTTDVVIQVRSDTPRVISYYTASIPVSDIEPKCFGFQSNEDLKCDYYHRGSVTDVQINLKNAIVRADTPAEIRINYTTPTTKQNSYTFSSEINDSTTNSIVIRYPKENGEPLWTSDPLQNIKLVGEYYEITINKPTHPSFSLLFGENVTYRFQITKVFTNSSKDENQTFELYVPTDTNTQTVIWDEISPPPNVTLQDEDGNYIFKYIVAPNGVMDCKITGYIQKNISENKVEVKQSFLTQKSGYWSINSNTEFKRINNFLQKKGLNIDSGLDDIKELEGTEKELFYKYVYQYVIDRLNYDPETILGISNETRLGANALTESPNSSSAVDYADFLISILRKYNVPSRLVVGFVSNITGYTSDGFYHHWVEYYDDTKEQWVTADPFLEEYFEKGLFGSSFHDHIVILRRGKSAVAPKISFFNENDFTVRSETEKDIKAEFDVKSELDFEDYKITDKYLKGYIYVSNKGNTIVNGYNITKSNISNMQKYLDPVSNLQSQIIIPSQNSTLQLNIPNEKINDSKIFANVIFRNHDLYQKETLLEKEVGEIIPGYLLILAKSVSLVVFAGGAFLIYFLLKIIKQKRKNG
jgi:hypothetical protein